MRKLVLGSAVLALVVAAACSKTSEDDDNSTKISANKPQPAPDKPAKSTKTKSPVSVAYGVSVAGFYDLVQARRSGAPNNSQYVLVTATAIHAGAAPVGKTKVIFPGKQVKAEELVAWLDTERAKDARGAETGAQPGKKVAKPKPTGGTGTAMAHSEGKMGKKDSRREKGQYAIEKTKNIPQLANRWAIERKRALGVFGQVIQTAANDDQWYYGKPKPGSPNDQAPNVFAWGARFDAPLLLADGKLKASRIADVVAWLCHHGARLGVANKFMISPAAHKIALATYQGKKCKGDPQPRNRHQIVSRATRPSPRGLALHLEKDGYQLYDGATTRAVTKSVGDLRKAVRAMTTLGRYRLFVAVGPKVTVADLAAMLDELNLFVRVVHLGTNYSLAKAAATERRSNRGAARDRKTAWGTLGGGPYGTLHGGKTNRERARRNDPHLSLGHAQATGDLPKTLIRRYVKRYLRKIRHCYVIRLAVKKHLKGTVRVSFTILPSGTVIASMANGVDPVLSSCVARVIARIRFPKPKGGGVVNVKYPFHFRLTP